LLDSKEDLNKDVLGRVERHVVKLYGMDSANQLVSEFTGTMCVSQPIIWTTGRDLHFGLSAISSGATTFIARYFDGTEERCSVVVQPEPWTDLLILQGTRTIAQDLHASMAARCDAVYVLGCQSWSMEVSVDHGMVSAMELDAFYVTTRPDAGWSGGPVVNKKWQVNGTCARRCRHAHQGTHVHCACGADARICSEAWTAGPVQWTVSL
jgi:hypothetical protein